MKLLFGLVTKKIGYGFVLSQYIVLCLESTLRVEKYACCLKIHQISCIQYGKHTVYTDGGTWYPEACNVLRLKHYLHSPFQKSLMERVNQYFKDRTERFDDYYPCMQKDEYNLFHVYNWIQFFFVSMYNDTTSKKNYFIHELNDRGEYISS